MLEQSRAVIEEKNMLHRPYLIFVMFGLAVPAMLAGCKTVHTESYAGRDSGQCAGERGPGAAAAYQEEHNVHGLHGNRPHPPARIHL